MGRGIRNRQDRTKRRVRTAAASAFLGTALLCASAAPAAVLGTAAAILWSGTAWAVETGTYLVTVTPSYTDPETGKTEDPGNNEAIGQGMTQKLCGPQGLLEVDASGNMYLTVRYYLSQFVSDVSFEERSGGSYTACSYQKMQTKDPVSGADNLDDKYGYTDYRIPIQSLDSVFRGKAYIEPMGRDVVYFFQASSPVAGSGDFVTSLQAGAETKAETADAGATDTGAAGTGAAAEGTADPGTETEGTETNRGRGGETDEPEEEGNEAFRDGADASSGTRNGEDDWINGSGDEDAPVTGIPEKPSFDRNGYDLSAVSAEDARKLTDPILETATGITLTVGELPGGDTEDVDIVNDSKKNANKSVMYALLGISAVLLIRFGAAFASARRRDSGQPEYEGAEEELPSAEEETEGRGEGR